MCSSDKRKHRPLFIVQSGIVAWEDPQPIADWRWQTVSVVSGTLSAAIPLLWALVASDSQKRRSFAQLKNDPPGFSETTLHPADTHVCVTSTLSDPSVVDFDYLTSYRRCALVEVEDSAAERLQAVCATLTDLGGSGISTLLNGVGSPAILRALGLESHAVIQLIGASDVTDSAIGCLADRRIRQFHDIRALPQELSAFADELPRGGNRNC